MTYRAPVDDIAFALRHAAGLGPALAEGLYGDLSDDVVEAVLEEAGTFATDVLAPLNHGRRPRTARPSRTARSPPRRAGRRPIAPGRQAGWNGLAAPARMGRPGPAAGRQRRLHRDVELGRHGLRHRPGADHGRRSTRSLTHGTDELKHAYLPKLVSGEWMGTMQLTEPQAGSDVGALRTKAERAADGSYRITGQKIFITYGEHDLTDNIIHLVLARLPDAPPGTKGISLFLVPKFLLNADGSLGGATTCAPIRSSTSSASTARPPAPWCYGDRGGATGFLIGEENRGMACMFTMMNQARLSVALQGVAIAERATQQALAYARERRQGRANGAPIRTRARSSRIPTSSACCSPCAR